MTISFDAPWSALFQGAGLLFVVVAAVWFASMAARGDPRGGRDAPYDGDGSSP